MMLALSEDCPIFAAGNEIHLHRMLGSVAKRWHFLVRPGPEVLERKLPSDIWSLYGEVVVQSIKASINAAHGVLTITDCQACDPEKIGDYCNTASVVLVENATTDGDFIRCVMEKIRPRLAGAFARVPRQIEIRQAGGIGEIPKELRRLAEQYERMLPNGNTTVRRLVAVTDSDAAAPGVLSENARDVERAASQLGLKAHILAKRTIENYLPDAALTDYCSSRRDRLSNAAQIINLTPPARDHYPMKKGLSDAELERNRSMYPADMVQAIGLGDFIADLLQNYRHVVDAAGLRQRDHANELDTLLDLLEEHL